MQLNSRFLPICLLGSCFAASGCASLFTAGTWGSGPMPPYAGFGAEVCAVAHTIAHPPEPSDITGPNLAACMLVLVDMPMSFAMDTVLLPVCLIQNLDDALERKLDPSRTDYREIDPIAARPVDRNDGPPTDAPESEDG